MKIIVRQGGNIGPFDSIETLPDRLRCYRKGQPEDYPLNVLGEHEISEDPSAAPVTLPQSETRNEAVVRINAEFEQAMSAIKSVYPDSEREGWPQQQREAEAWLADANAPTPVIDAMIAQTGELKSELVQKIVENVTAFTMYYGTELGRKRKKIAELPE